MKCPRCAGAKRIMSIGYMDAACPRCDGLGSIPDVAMSAVNTESCEKVETRKPESIKKRGK